MSTKMTLRRTTSRPVRLAKKDLTQILMLSCGPATAVLSQSKRLFSQILFGLKTEKKLSTMLCTTVCVALAKFYSLTRRKLRLLLVTLRRSTLTDLLLLTLIGKKQIKTTLITLLGAGRQVARRSLTLTATSLHRCLQTPVMDFLLQLLVRQPVQAPLPLVMDSALNLTSSFRSPEPTHMVGKFTPK